jgi:uncharacterized protein
MRNAITWFEIPTTDLERAARFYEKALGIELRRESFMDVPHATFPAERPHGVGGALILDRTRTPAATGTTIYLDVAGRLDAVLARVPDAGGQVVLARTAIGEPGFIALVRDPDGNVVGLHSPT